MALEADESRTTKAVSLSPTDDLSPLSLEDLRARIEALQGEIRRTEAMLASKQGAMGAAEAVFKP